MDFKKLDELVKIEKKSDASKEKKSEFYREMTSLIMEEGISDNVMKYTEKGFSFCGVKPLADYLESINTTDRYEEFLKIMRTDLIKENSNNIAFRLEINLLSYALLWKEPSNDIVRELLMAIPAKAKSKSKKKNKNDNSKFNGNTPTIIRNQFLLNITEKTRFPEIKDLNIKGIFIKEFVELLNFVLNGKDTLSTSNKKKLNSVINWLTGSNNESTAENKAEKNVDAHQVVKLETKLDAVVEIKEEQVKENDVVELNPNELDAFAKSLSEVLPRISATATYISTILGENSRLKGTVSSLERKTESLNDRLANKDKEIQDLNTKVKSIEDEKSKVEIDLAVSDEKVRSQNEEIESLKRENEKLNSVVSIYSADKENSKSEQLNAIASKLKAEYRDFMDAEDMEMTLDLGENMRFQLKSIFKILAKAGIDVESR